MSAERFAPSLDRIVADLRTRVDRLERRGGGSGSGSAGVAFADEYSAGIGEGGSSVSTLPFAIATPATCVALWCGWATNGGESTEDFSARALVSLDANSGPQAIQQFFGTTAAGTAVDLTAVMISLLEAGDHTADVALLNESTTGNITQSGVLTVMTFAPSGSLSGGIED